MIATRRLLLRPFATVDPEELQAAITESLDDLRPWMVWVHPPPTLENTRAFLQQRAAVLARADGEAYDYAGLDPETGAFVLAIGIFRIDAAVRAYEFGFWRRSSAPARTGLMREAVLAMTAHAFDELGVRRLQLKFNARNVAVAELVRRVGFWHEGRLHNESVDPWSGELRDVDIYAHTPQTWRRFVDEGS